MTVKKDPSGRRSVELEFELPGTPEQVWQAIATGPGISSWFVQTEVEEREGGAIAFHLGPGMDSSGVVTAWQPPYRFAYEERDWDPKAPALGTELVVEARSGGTCKVRLVHSLFTSQDDWDDQLESMETGWPPYFEVLRHYLTYHAGMPSASVRVDGHHPGSDTEAWDVLLQALGLSGAAAGEWRNMSVNGAPLLTGTLQRINRTERHYELMIRLEKPSTGIGLIGTYKWAAQVHVAICLFFYGDDAAAVAEREAPLWKAWVERVFPATQSARAG